MIRRNQSTILWRWGAMTIAGAMALTACGGDNDPQASTTPDAAPANEADGTTTDDAVAMQDGQAAATPAGDPLPAIDDEPPTLPPPPSKISSEAEVASTADTSALPSAPLPNLSTPIRLDVCSVIHDAEVQDLVGDYVRLDDFCRPDGPDTVSMNLSVEGGWFWDQDLALEACAAETSLEMARLLYVEQGCWEASYDFPKFGNNPAYDWIWVAVDDHRFVVSADLDLAGLEELATRLAPGLAALPRTTETCTVYDDQALSAYVGHDVTSRPALVRTDKLGWYVPSCVWQSNTKGDEEPWLRLAVTPWTTFAGGEYRPLEGADHAWAGGDMPWFGVVHTGQQAWQLEPTTAGMDISERQELHTGLLGNLAARAASASSDQ